jgi:polysaccharide export outer membrane protein
MDTTLRSTTVKNKSAWTQACSRFAAPALLAAALSLSASAQVSGTQSTSQQPVQTFGASAAGVAGSRASAASHATSPVVLPADIADLRIEPGDLLSISVFDTPEFSDTYRVDSAGDVTLPLCGKLRVLGLSSVNAAAMIATAYKDGQILVRPQVTVDVEQYAGHFVTVLGEVASPGRVTVIAPTRLSDILAQVGGLTSIAGTRIKIRHGVDAGAQEEDVPYSRSESNLNTGAVLVQGGDTVVVPRTGIVYVLGAVYRPGGYVMQEDGKLNVAEALALSGGTVLTARTNGLRVIRRNQDGSILELNLSYDDISKGTQEPLALKAQDIVYVPMSKLKASFTDATGILSAATSAAIYTAR